MKNATRIICCFLIFFFLAGGLPAAAGDATETTGDVLSLLIPASAYVITFCHKDTPGRRQFEKSFLTSVGAVYGMKTVIDQDGPNGQSHSFPSGHSALAVAGFLQRRYGVKYGLPAFVAAGFVGYSRVESDNHRWVDVAAGAGISILGTLYFVSPYGEEIGLVPFLAGKGYTGLALIGRW
jgi:membrane-associated phospholipid phosphatase